MVTRSLPSNIRRTMAGRGPLVGSVIVLGWSSVELVNLAMTHTAEAEIYGVLTAALAASAAVVAGRCHHTRQGPP
jgi:hypothetical protein